MSKGHQKYQQSEMKIQKQGLEGDLNAPYYKNAIYYPFQNTPTNYYYSYLYPYTESPCLPYYPPPYLTNFNPSPAIFAPAIPKIEEGERNITEHHMVKSESVEPKNYLIKIQDIAPDKKPSRHKQETVKSEEKKFVKQLYFGALNQDASKMPQQDLTVLIAKFKKIVRAHIQETIDEVKPLSYYQAQFAKQIAENKSFFEELMTYLTQRFKNFKKTKEELIKYIIRRTYHNLKINKNFVSEKPEYERLEAFHQKNLTAFKSMNIQFLKRQFSNQLFVQIFKDFIKNLDETFDKENNEKADRFSYILVNCWYQKSTNLLQHERKLPWVSSYKLRIKKICLDLLKQYDGSTSKDSESIKLIKK